MAIIKRALNQTPLDFVLQQTGSISNVMNFLLLNKINYGDFYQNSSYEITPVYNNTTSIYQKQGITVATLTLIPPIPKIKGDYNYDFNDDFFNTEIIF